MVKNRIKTIPKEIKNEVTRIVEAFNQSKMMPENCFYVPRFKGRFCYLDRNDFGRTGQICRIAYTGDMENWRFAIFLWSSETYTKDMDFSPGSKLANGTVEGAMKAGLAAYPV